MGNWFSKALGAIPVVGPLISSGLDLLTGTSAANKTNNTNLQIARETNQAQMELAQYQADRNYQLWQENNAYNSPSAQMDRYKEAGLNPNLIYGEGSSSAGNSSSPAEGYQAPTLQRATAVAPRIDSGAIANAFGQSMLMAADIAKKRAEVDNLHQNTVNLQSDNELRQLQIIMQNYQNSKTRDEAFFWKDLMENRVKSLQGSAHLSESNALTNDLIRPHLVELKKVEVQQAMLQNEDIRYKVEKLNPAQAQKLYTEIANLIAQSQLYKANAALSMSNIDLNDRKWMESTVKQHGMELNNKILQKLADYGINVKESGVIGLVNKIIGNIVNF